MYAGHWVDYQADRGGGGVQQILKMCPQIYAAAKATFIRAVEIFHIQH